jgi:hypothetical protein
MTVLEARLGSIVRAMAGCQWASAGSQGKIVGYYFLGQSIHAVSVRWDLPDQESVEPTIIPRDHLNEIELVRAAETTRSPSRAVGTARS